MSDSNKHINKCTVKITPFMQGKFKYIKIHLHESIGGDLAYGDIEFDHPDDSNAKNLIKSEKYVELEINSNEIFTYKIKGLITKRTYDKHYFYIEFVCVPDKEFIENPISLEHIGIDNAIKYCWTGNIDNRQCVTDLNQDIQLVQFRETSYDFLTRTLRGYKYNSIFGYGLEGLLIKDIKGYNVFGEKEPDKCRPLISDTNNITEEFSTSRDRNYNYGFNSHDAWSEGENEKEYNWNADNYRKLSKNISVITTGSAYNICHTNFLQLRKNYDHNMRFFTSSMFSNIGIVTNNMLQRNYKLGDLIIYMSSKHYDIETQRKNKPKDLYYVVYENDFLITNENSGGNDSSANRGFRVKSILKCVQNEKGEWLKW